MYGKMSVIRRHCAILSILFPAFWVRTCFFSLHRKVLFLLYDFIFCFASKWEHYDRESSRIVCVFGQRTEKCARVNCISRQTSAQTKWAEEQVQHGNRHKMRRPVKVWLKHVHELDIGSAWLTSDIADAVKVHVFFICIVGQISH